MAPSNALCIVQSEISLISTALRCNTRVAFRGHQEEIQSPLYKSFIQLKAILNRISALNEIEPLVYLTPFLEVIRSEDTTGPITGLALTAVDKFLSYGLLELPDTNLSGLPQSGPGSIKSVSIAVEAIAESGTQARFVGTDRSSDEVVLMKVLHLLRTLLLVPVGSLVSDRVVREILQSCFRICFEPKLSELLRRTAELCLASIIQLFFSRLPSLIAASHYQECEVPAEYQQVDTAYSSASDSFAFAPQCTTDSNSEPLSEIHGEDVVSPANQRPSHAQTAVVTTDKVTAESSENPSTEVHPHHSDESRRNDVSDVDPTVSSCDPTRAPFALPTSEANVDPEHAVTSHGEFISPQATCSNTATEPSGIPLVEQPASSVHDDPSGSIATHDSSVTQPQPYGLPAVHDLLHYLISLLTPERNADGIISVSLGLVTIALETGADAISHCPSLLQLVQGDLTKHLLLLLYSDRVWQFAATLRVCFMLFESMRKHLKLQMEVYLQRLTAICSTDNETTSYERREVALDSVVRLFLVPGLATELYVNYDCDPYCSNLFEDITKMLAKNAYPVDRLMGTHLLSLDALLAVLNTIGTQCVNMMPTTTEEIPSQQSKSLSSSIASSGSTVMKTDGLRHVNTRINRHTTGACRLPSREQLTASKAAKKVLMLGSEQFNLKPKKGIELLQHYGILQSPLDPTELAHFLRENPRLDKRMIGEYLSDRKNGEVLTAYVRQFNFKGVQIDEALRIYLEAFRLPGEAPLIQRIMEQFAEQWYYANDQPFADVDSAFTLAYAILMLNTDQHNPNSKKQNAPMTSLDFKKNLSGMNGTGDFDPKLLDAIYKSIHKSEIVMPCEQTGLVRENYLWKCLLRRSATSQADFIHAQPGTLDADLFDVIWGPTVSALSFIFDKTLDPAVQCKAVDGFIRCAAIAAHHGMSDVLDNLVISLCKFTTLLTTGDSPATLCVSLGRNTKALLALQLVFTLTANHADILRYGWHSLLDCLLQLFRCNLLPNELIEAEDFVSPFHRVRLTTKGCVPVIEASSRHRSRCGPGGNKEVSVFSSFYQYLTTGSAWTGSGDEDEDEEEDQDHSACTSRPSPDMGGNDEGPEGHGRRLGQFSGSYWANISQNSGQLDDASAARLASVTVAQCEIVQLIKDTKFLVDASLVELIKALLRAIRGDAYASLPFPSHTTTEWHSVEHPSNIAHTDPQAPQNESPPLELCALSGSTHSLSLGQSTPNEVANKDSVSPDHSLKRSMTMPASTPLATSSAPSASYYPAFFASGGGGILTEECRIFCFELLVRILLYNRDRVMAMWSNVQYYLADMLLSAPEPTPLIERVVVGFLRLATCLLRRHEMTSQIFACLHYIMLTRGDQLLLVQCSNASSEKHTTAGNRPPSTRPKGLSNETRNGVGLQIVAGLTDLLRNHAADLPDPATDWQLIFGLLEVCGAGLRAPPATRRTHHTSMQDIATGRTCDHTAGLHSDRGYTSDSEAPELTYNRPKTVAELEEGTLGDPNSGPSAESDEPGVSTIRTSSVNAWIVVDVGTTVNQTKPGSIYPDTSPSVDESERPIRRLPHSHRLVPSSVLALPVTIGLRDSVTLERAADCLAFLVRDPAHITPENFEYCVVALRVFVEACLRRHTNWVHDSGLTSAVAVATHTKTSGVTDITGSWTSPQRSSRSSRNVTGPTNISDGIRVSSPTTRPRVSRESDSDSDSEYGVDDHAQRRAIRAKLNRELLLSPTTGIIAVQLLDLIHLLLTRATSIYTEWKCVDSVNQANASNAATEVAGEMTGTGSTAIDADYLWPHGWRPLLQAIARLCCDCRREVRTDALACLNRVLLSSVLQSLSGAQWEDCFEKVLFPLLSGFLESIALEEAAMVGACQSPRSTRSTSGSSAAYHTTELADPRMRAIPLLTKVFLQHLRPLHKSDNFHALWSRILVYMEQYMQASSSDSLTDAVRESLKNVLLVMYTGTHDTPPILLRAAVPETPGGITLWDLTAKQLSTFLPELLDQLFPQSPPQTASPVPSAEVVSISDCGQRIQHSSQNHHVVSTVNVAATLPADSIITAQPAQSDPVSDDHTSRTLVQEQTESTAASGQQPPPTRLIDAAHVREL